MHPLHILQLDITPTSLPWNGVASVVKVQYGLIEFSQFLGVLVSCGCYNKLPHTWQLKTAENHSFTVLIAINHGVSRAVLPPKSLGKKTLSRSLPDSDGLSFPLCGCGTLISACVFLRSFSLLVAGFSLLLLIRTLIIGLRASKGEDALWDWEV